MKFPGKLIHFMLFALLLGLGGAFVMLQPAQATSVPIGGLWQEFSFGSDLNTFADIHGCFPADPSAGSCDPSAGGNSTFAGAPPWTFTNTNENVALTVTDAFLSGDQFKVFDSGTLIGSTSAVAQGNDCGSDPVPCSTDPNISHGVFNLGPGSHSINFQKIASASVNTGAAYFRTDVVSEPGSLLLLGSGLPVLIFARRRARGRRSS